MGTMKKILTSYNNYKDYVECEDFSMYRSTQNYENQQKMLFVGVGEYGIPQIEPTSYNPCEFLSFNYAKSCKDRADHGILRKHATGLQVCNESGL